MGSFLGPLGPDYQELLRRGHVVVHAQTATAEKEFWRQRMRRLARSDKVRICTGDKDGVVYAVMLDRPALPLAEAREMLEAAFSHDHGD